MISCEISCHSFAWLTSCAFLLTSLFLFLFSSHLHFSLINILCPVLCRLTFLLLWQQTNNPNLACVCWCECVESAALIYCGHAAVVSWCVLSCCGLSSDVYRCSTEISHVLHVCVCVGHWGLGAMEGMDPSHAAGWRAASSLSVHQLEILKNAWKKAADHFQSNCPHILRHWHSHNHIHSWHVCKSQLWTGSSGCSTSQPRQWRSLDSFLIIIMKISQKSKADSTAAGFLFSQRRVNHRRGHET